MEKRKSSVGYLIFGASGFLGSRLFDELQKNNKQICLGTNSKNLINSENKILRNYHDLNDLELEKVVSEYEVIIDASGISTNNTGFLLKNYIERNAIWPFRLAKACIRAKSRLIWISTIHAEKYDNNSLIEFDKYSFSKFTGELMIKNIKNWENNILIIRLGNVIGSPGKIYNGSYNLFALDIANNLVKNKKAFIKNKQDKFIRTSSFFDFIKLIKNQNNGYHSCLTISRHKLTDIAFRLNHFHQLLTNTQSNIYFNNQIFENKKNSISNELDIDMKDLINYFLKL